MRRLCRYAVLAIVLAAVGVVGVVHAPVAAALTIRGDSLWTENPACPAHWEQPEIAAGDWRPIPFPWQHIWPQDWPLDPAARPFWGTSSFPQNCLRRVFELVEVPTGAAIAHVWADDDYEFFLNGARIGASADSAGTMPGESYDVAAHLRTGRNVVALRVTDIGGVMAALFSLEIPNVAGGPASPAGAGFRPWPWVQLACVLLLLAAWAGIVRVIAERNRHAALRLSSEAIAGRALVAAIGTQALLMSLPFYTGQPEIPVLDWSPLALLVLAAGLGALLVAGSQVAALPEEEPALRNERWWLAAIVCVAVLFRTLWLDTIPVGFFQDEATNGNDALALAKVDGWMLWSDSVGGRPTLFLYLLYYTLQVFGVSYLSLKIVPVVIGVATVVAVWALGRQAFGSRIALWAAFLIAVSRWHVHYSRMAWEAICLPLFAVGGLALLAYGLRNERLRTTAIVVGATVLSAGLYTYAAYRAVPVIALAFLAATILTAERTLVARRLPALLLGAVIAAAVAAPLAQFAAAQPELYWWRYNEVSLTSYMAYFGTPLPWLDQVGRSALSLHNVGDELIRHNLPHHPHLDPITGVLLLLGLATAVWRWRRFGERLALVWLVVFLVLAALTRDGPHATRLLGLVPACALLAAVGIESLGSAFAPRLGRRHMQFAAALLVASITAVNAYAYFVLEANHPTADGELNATGRAVCEYLRQQDDVVVYFSADIGFWSDGQCFFLARGRYEPPQPVRVEDVLPGNELRLTTRETVVVLGPEFFDLHRAQLQPEAVEAPLVDLQGEPLEKFDRQGQLLFRLYHFGGGRGSD